MIGRIKCKIGWHDYKVVKMDDKVIEFWAKWFEFPIEFMHMRNELIHELQCSRCKKTTLNYRMRKAVIGRLIDEGY